MDSIYDFDFDNSMKLMDDVSKVVWRTGVGELEIKTSCDETPIINSRLTVNQTISIWH